MEFVSILSAPALLLTASATTLLVACSAAPDHAVPEPVLKNFRADADQLYAIIEPTCAPTRNPALLARYRPGRDRTAALERRAAGTAFGQILQTTRTAHVQMGAVADCDAGDHPGVARLVTQEIQMLDRLLPRMEQTLSQYSAKG